MNDLVYISQNQTLIKCFKRRQNQPGFYDLIQLDEIKDDHLWTVNNDDPVLEGEDLTWAQVEEIEI